MPTLSAFDFQRLLSNLSSIKIRASYVPLTRTFLTDLVLNTAIKQSNKKSDSNIATHVEECECPLGYMGQHCQTCGEQFEFKVY
jgi:laminin gamma 1